MEILILLQTLKGVKMLNCEKMRKLGNGGAWRVVDNYLLVCEQKMGASFDACCNQTPGINNPAEI
jgi:hypothetical protein